MANKSHCSLADKNIRELEIKSKKVVDNRKS